MKLYRIKRILCLATTVKIHIFTKILYFNILTIAFRLEFIFQSPLFEVSKSALPSSL